MRCRLVMPGSVSVIRASASRWPISEPVNPRPVSPRTAAYALDDLGSQTGGEGSSPSQENNPENPAMQ